MTQDPNNLTNGPGAAAILSASIGCFLVGLFFLAEDASPAIAKFFTFYSPSGALSGVTTTAVVVWLALWYLLDRRWRNKTVQMRLINMFAFAFLVGSLLLTFPPFIDFLQGK
jgi:hypothetical protein